ncbi:MAG: enoyl-CoA hydratase/isomerase family protein [Nitrospira sp.]|nr:enoyl-CoA hydratase/isomerase family protein [Nitrospira sp.]MBS0166904.1 enoyl-CoA hydratase/isomerase family protein [Nitrospira sp.]
MKDSTLILVESNKNSARVILNRPDRRNAFDARMVKELCDVFTLLSQDSSLRAITLAGNGAVFCAGADINWLASESAVSAAQAREDAEQLARMFRTIDECPCPVIGQIQGPAFGGGVGLVAACDIAVAAKDATFALSEVRLGMVAGVIAPLLLRKTGDSFLRRFCLTGEVFSAAAAKQYNLVHDVVEKDQLGSRVVELVHAVSNLAPQAVRDTKALIRRLRAVPDDGRWNAGIEANAYARLSVEAQEGFRAFLERRSPVWTTGSGSQGKKSSIKGPYDVAERKA